MDSAHRDLHHNDEQQGQVATAYAATRNKLAQLWDDLNSALDQFYASEVRKE